MTRPKLHRSFITALLPAILHHPAVPASGEPKLDRFQWQALRKLCHSTTQEELEALIDKLLKSPTG